jgi:hypothetical protein
VNVRVPEGWAAGRTVPEARVELVAIIGAVDRWRVLRDDGAVLGFVWKGTRRWSPPTHKGSRIARFHRNVPEWHGSPHSTWHADIRKDTRVEVLRELLAAARP